ncbi:MAG: toprim domain-containing protein [Bacteroidales bacterium]|nr:toprim domain-containing protein [Bacteroidales bacterium]
MEISEIKSRLTILQVASHYGLKPNKYDMIICPFHEDKDPSLKLYYETNTFNCFSCAANGDVIEFIQLKEKCTKHEAILKAKAMIDINYTEVTKPEQAKSQPKDLSAETKVKAENHVEILSKIYSYFQKGINSGTAKRPKEYLQSRNLNQELLEIGYNSGQFHHRGKLNEADQKACIESGLLIPYNGSVPNAKGTTYTAFAKDCIIFPLKNKKNQIVSIYGRRIVSADNQRDKSAINNGLSRHFYLKDRTGLYPQWPKANCQKLILTEAIIDAATLLQLPEISKEYEILSLYGTNGLTEEHTEAIKSLKNLKEIIFFFDGDKAGIQAVSKYEEIFKKLRPEVELSTVVTPDEEDVNSLLVGHEPEIFTHLLNERIPLLKKVEKAVLKKDLFPTKKANKLLTEKTGIKEKEGIEVQTHNCASQQSKLNTRNPEFITYTTEELQITILGGINLQQLDRLRLTIKISPKDRTCPVSTIRHTLDLYHSDYLEKFITKASEQLETGTNILRRAIAELTDHIEQYRLTKIESMKEQKPKQRKLTEQRERMAISYLAAPKLMERTNTDIGRTGMIGEENNRLLMYLVFTSRLRENPLHIISLGASGTGKTYLQEKIAELIPENDKLEITILSENAFYYFDRKELKNKLVLIEDMDGAENVLYPLRELQSKKKISKTIPIKDSKGNLKTITLQVEGPICLAGTTTKEKLYEDNSNRSLLIYIDNGSQHKEHIMEYQRKLSAGKVNNKEENQLKEFFKDMQTVLKPIKVRNPYAEYLKLPEYVFKPLRTNSHYLAVIETITFYHQYQREIKTDRETGERYIETTLEDIEWANILLKDVLLSKSDELPRAVREFFESLKRWIKKEKKENFYAKEVRERLRMYPMKVNRYMYELESRGFIRKTGGNRKTGFEYEIYRWDDYKKLQAGTDVMNEILEQIRSKTRSVTLV